MSAMHERLEELLFTSASGPFSEAERTELNALLRDHAEARAFAARQLTLDALLAESLAASMHTTAFQPIPIAAGKSLQRPNWLARAAAWIGAIHLYSNTAKASTVLTQSTPLLLMKKTVTSITAAILVLGGSGIYLIHRNNESSRTRVATIETEIQALSDQLGINTTRSANSRLGATDARKTVSITQVLAIFGGDNIISTQEAAVINQFKEQLAAMDAESLKNLLLDAEKISNPINGRLGDYIMKELISKDPAEATQIATQLIGRGFSFQFQMSHRAVDAFQAWQAKDPAAADIWYVATAAAGGFNSKSIAPNGLENLTIDRSLARLRFAAQVVANPAEAAAMTAGMVPDDVTAAMKEITNPDTVRKFIPKLPLAQQGPAAEGAIKAMAATDPKAAFTWATALEMGDRERDSLLATGIEAAVGSGKLDLAGVSEWSKDLNLDAARHSQMLVSAATSVSLIPRENQNRIDPNHSVYWDRVAERIDWLRREAPAESAGKTVGDYLGKLSYESRNLDQSLAAYEHEVARQGTIDPDLAITFATYLSMQESDSVHAAALKLLNQLPPSERRDNLIDNIEINR